MTFFDAEVGEVYSPLVVCYWLLGFEAKALVGGETNRKKGMEKMVSFL